MRSRLRYYGVLMATLALFVAVLSACGSSSSSSSSESSESTESTESGSTTSAEAEGPEGFTLNESIAEHAEGEPNVRLSFINPCVAGGPPIKAGMSKAAKEFGVNAEMIGPCSGNVSEQISGVSSLIRAHAVDCLGIMSGGSPDQMVNVTNQAVEAGIPTFTYNVDIPSSKRFAYFGPQDSELAEVNANTVVKWAEEENIELKKVAIVSFEPNATWASDRIEAFEKIVGEAFPGVEFGSPVTEGYASSENQSAINGVLLAEPDVNFIFSTDQTEITAKILKEKGLTGKVFTSGFNYTPGTIQGVIDGQTVVTVSQDFPQQGYETVKACAEFLKEGKLPAQELNYVKGIPITAANAKEYVGQTG